MVLNLVGLNLLLIALSQGSRHLFFHLIPLGSMYTIGSFRIWIPEAAQEKSSPKPPSHFRFLSDCVRDHLGQPQAPSEIY